MQLIDSFNPLIVKYLNVKNTSHHRSSMYQKSVIEVVVQLLCFVVCVRCKVQTFYM